jgi:hypothetical protein
LSVIDTSYMAGEVVILISPRMINTVAVEPEPEPQVTPIPVMPTAELATPIQPVIRDSGAAPTVEAPVIPIRPVTQEFTAAPPPPPAPLPAPEPAGDMILLPPIRTSPVEQLGLPPLPQEDIK